MSQSTSPFRLLRIIILLTILGIVAASQYQTYRQTAQWQQSQWAVIYPINADNDPKTQDYINTLNLHKFAEIETYLNREAHRYGVDLATPFTLQLAPQIASKPPILANERTLLATIWFSLKLRYYGLTTNSYEGPEPDIKIYINYFAPKAKLKLAHSVGIEKGKISVINAVASWKFTPFTNVIITHEILHTVGATDKYDMASNLPHFPEGYGDPNQSPLLPQTRAEIMGGAIIISKIKLELPMNLSETTVGKMTATELNW